MYTLLKQFLAKNMAADEAVLDAFCQKFRLKKTRRNEVLLSAGDVCPYIYFVNSGCLRIYMMDVNGKESTRFLVTEGQFRYGVPEFYFAGTITGLYPKHRAHRGALH
jgi:CRP-like cAMP-binding protein